MKKNLSLIAYISISISFICQILVISLVKPIYLKLNKNELDQLVYIIIVLSAMILLIFGVITLILLIKNTVKSTFIGSIILITLGVLLIPTIFSYTWIFGIINIICGVIMIIIGSIHLKTTREYL
ncbi:hypothetical protein [Spiroplasma diminutum]|uniref:Transmembrane protein n=1 Tax=Spiroplasma diminutum CUAS-1 TaxID=1276221 RepID=S5MDN2_9MOLU|nr:hypothetical protein [Spiroplasma diminutum]AGR41828.1 hypothetical protein SDIMI_v3c01240 [Spiroplasma diminutum CUAS-1]